MQSLFAKPLEMLLYMAQSPLPNWAKLVAQAQVGSCELSAWASYHWLFYFYELANFFIYIAFIFHSLNYISLLV